MFLCARYIERRKYTQPKFYRIFILDLKVSFFNDWNVKNVTAVDVLEFEATTIMSDNQRCYNMKHVY